MVATVSRGRGRRTINEINMVPFIDVMLVLLIIFMVTAPLISPSVIDLPSIGKANKQPDQVLQITINKSGGLEVKATTASGKPTPMTLEKIIALSKSKQTGQTITPVVISADRSVKYETVVKVMDGLQKAGIQRVGLSVQLEN
jgi:biopolymer transport protein TolR